MNKKAAQGPDLKLSEMKVKKQLNPLYHAVDL